MTLPAAADMRAAQALALLAVDPVGLGGAVLASRATPARDAWVTALIEASGANTPVRRIPLHVADDRLNGGLDLAATLASGRPIAMRGLLAEANGGIVVLANAERIAPLVASSIALAIENGHSAGHAARFAVVALDEGDDTDEAAPAQIQDRLAFRIDAASFEAIPAGLFLAL
ncbi:MAG: magnesium chelatase ATPase subunit D, partial [Hyphomicrobium aestuarii]|nr:magnesium chelatase ATPase subunit D [Hyphomicrobium aestuarii]